MGGSRWSRTMVVAFEGVATLAKVIAARATRM
jgi:hypothetical protein